MQTRIQATQIEAGDRIKISPAVYFGRVIEVHPGIMLIKVVFDPPKRPGRDHNELITIHKSDNCLRSHRLPNRKRS